MDIRHILAPTDFSDYSKKALSDALDLAQTFGAKLSLLHVIEPPPYPIAGFVHRAGRGPARRSEAAGQR